MKFSQPHVIAFLGDLMDEGHVANAEDFERYKRRLDSIFSTPDDIMVFTLVNNIYFSSSLAENLHFIIWSCFLLENLLARRQ